MKKRKAEEVLEIMISQLLRYLEELYECKNETGQQFKYGERTAYKESSEKKKTAVFSRRSQARKPPFFSVFKSVKLESGKAIRKI